MVKKAGGFTLIELSVVLLIIVIGFAVVGSNISSGNQATELKTTVRDLISALRFTAPLTRSSWATTKKRL